MSRGRKQDAAPDASVTFTYESAYNQIVHPTNYVSLSQYFIAHWMPDISPAGLKILLQLRSMGYYSPKANFQRGDIDIEQKELAALCGMSLSTLKRAFSDDPILSSYVQRVFETKRDPLTGRIVKEHYLYVVKMDDVLTPADKAKLAEMLQGPDKGAGNPLGLPTAQNDPSVPPPIAQNDLPGVQNEPPMGQNEPPMGQNEPPMGQNEPPMGQNDPSLNRSLYTSITLNTPNTAALPGDCATLFEEEDAVPEKPVLRRWQDLTESDQQPFVDQARRELVVIHTGTGITPKPKLVEVRAKNLYEMSLRS